MASFASHPRRVLSHEQTPRFAASDSIADLDGVNDGSPHRQQLRDPIPQQYPYDVLVPAPMTERQSHIADLDGGLPDHRRPDLQSTQQQQVEVGQHEPHSSARAVQEEPNADQKQYETTIQQSPARATAVEPSQASPEHLQALYRDQVPSSPHAAANTGEEIQMKQEPELEDDVVFATYTNEAIFDEDGEAQAETFPICNNTNGPIDQVPNPATSIKLEPEFGSETKNSTTEQVGIVNHTITPDHGALAALVAAPHQTPPSRNDIRPSEINFPMFPKTSETVGSVTQQSLKAIPQDGVPTSESPQTGTASDFVTECSFEKYAQNSRLQSAESLQWSADPIKGLQQHSSAETALSLSGMDSMANDTSFLAQQWQQRPQLSNTVPLSEDMIHINPRLLHGPMPTSLPSDHLTRQLTNDLSTPFTVPSHIRQGSYSQHLHASQSHTNFVYRSSVPYQGHSLTASQMRPYGHFMPLDCASRYPLPNMPTPNHLATNSHIPVGSINSRNDQVEAEEVEASEDSEPVKARASCPRSETTSLALPPSAFDSNGSIIYPQPSSSVPEVSMTGANPDAIDPPSNDDESDAEPISWKLPSFEAAYQEPQTPDDLPTARISIPNLVREHVMLTEDHSRQEMQLFLELFLPAQQTLAEPDPEPAHAVLNFHTISVMVLEAFVQWEIGDELGRGYGFLGGNTAIRPPAPPSEEEPDRIRSATDADVDDIFFTVIDRWRAGILANKGTFKLIRGVQEFCDVALDIIHFVKEHGLLPPEQKNKRKERSDKGSARGPKDDNKTKAAGPATKRKSEPEKKGKVNSLQPRKKPKVGADSKPKKPAPKANTKAKSNNKRKREAGVTVIQGRT